MTNEVTGMITSITERNLVRKSDNAPFTLFDFETQPMGKMSTSKRELREQGSVLIGAPVTIQYTEKPGNPGYPPNRYIEKITPAPQGTLIQQGAEAPVAPLHASEAQPLQNVSIGRDEAIWRQTATKTAASFNNADLAQYWERVEMLITFYRTGVIPAFGPTNPPDTVPPAPETIPLGIDTGDDIPFVYSIY